MFGRPSAAIWLSSALFSGMVRAEGVTENAFGGVSERTVPLRTHSIFAPYVDSDLQNRWFDYGGNAIINTNKHIRLTQERPSQSGWIWSRLPLTPTSWEIEVEFRIDGSNNAMYGDGMAMWLTTGRAIGGSVFGNQDKWNGLGLMFDTFANSRHSYSFPQIVAIINDGTIAYDHGKDGAGQETARCSIDYRRTEAASRAKLTYVKDDFLELQIQHEEWDRWTTCFTLRNITLPESPFLGFTAVTGQVSDEHDLISISATNVVYHPPSPGAPHKKVTTSRRRASDKGFFTFIATVLKWGTILIICIVAFMVWKGYSSKKAAKRF